MNVSHGLSLLISFIINTIFLHYVYTLEKNQCECSKSWKRDYIKYYSIIMITTLILAMLIPVFKKKIFTQMVSILYIIVVLGGLINLWCLYSYTKKLKEIDCECSEGWERKFIHTYSTLVVVLWIIGILLPLLFMPTVIIVKESNLKRK